MEKIKEGAVFFVTWTKLKIRIHFSVQNLYPRERQIWWVNLGYNIGVEMNGKNEKFERPVLVLKRFNEDSCLVVPLSTKIKNERYHLHFKNSKGQLVSANFSQIKSISIKRFIRKIEKMNPRDFEKSKEFLKESI